MTKALAAILLALTASGSVAAKSMEAPHTSAQTPTQISSAEADFALLATLVGDWKNAENPDSKLRIRFALTAGGTVLQESWLVGDRLHSLTLYHRDGAQLVVTHYCPQGNQPTLAQTEGGPMLAFTFRSASDLDAATENYLHDLSFDLSNPNRPIRREVYRGVEGDDVSVLVLERVE